MFGVYENFPKTVHGIAHFACQNPTRKMQQTIFSLFFRLNQEIYDFSAITYAQVEKCLVSFEFGVAEDNNFNYIDKEELNRSYKTVAKERLLNLDFFYVIRYHRINAEGKRFPLKFDYYILRFFFQEKSMELHFAHQHGTQRVSTEDLAMFFQKQINIELSEKRLEPIKLDRFVKFPLFP